RLIRVSVCPSSMEKISEQIGETFRAQEHQAAQRPSLETAHKVLAAQQAGGLQGKKPYNGCGGFSTKGGTTTKSL
ncbi:MAG: hypothetical protein OEV78_06495, partial [Spirochaetia bacterium]|nr:hypothetical protein [Spirochaetia bacterium]